ncbi:MAG: transcriptional repressor [Eubacterium sp.]|nr:transcriptional repressor [Eubacterium sp.]
MAVSRGNYKSKHYEELLDWFQSIPGRHVTVQEVYSHFLEQNTNIGITTLYRLLDRLVQEGAVAKYSVDAASPACYEYIADNDEEREEHFCYHVKCEKCGRLIHLHCDEMEELQEHFLSEHRFRLDPRRTVLYGICADCLNSTK